ncbi:hypothetical protein J6590_034527 [Homalodisca vitripennis]|nr:hypothetical protein J6590_034527 [Homalodisca vitripennis]
MATDSVLPHLPQYCANNISSIIGRKENLVTGNIPPILKNKSILLVLLHITYFNPTRPCVAESPCAHDYANTGASQPLSPPPPVPEPCRSHWLLLY